MASNSGILIPPPAPPPTVASTNDIRPIKPPVEVPEPLGWLVWPAGVLVAGIIITTALMLWLKGRRRDGTPPIPPQVRARQKLDAALLLIHEPRTFCRIVSDAVRVYLEERFSLRAPERTTEEFLRDVQTTPALNPQQKMSLTAFLEQCDLVKFARVEPAESLLRELHDSAQRLVHETQYVVIEEPDAAAHRAIREARLRHRKGEVLAIIGYGLQAIPVFFAIVYSVGLFGTLRLMIDLYLSFQVDGLRSLLQTYWEMINFIFAGLLPQTLTAGTTGLAGLVLLIISITRFGYRARWLLWFLMIYAALVLAVVPVGTLWSLFIFAFCGLKWHEFLAGKPVQIRSA